MESNPQTLEEMLLEYEESSALAALQKHRDEAMALQREGMSTRIPSEMVPCLDAGKELSQLVEKDIDALSQLPRITRGDLERLKSLRLALWQSSLDVLLSVPASRRALLLKTVEQLRDERRRLFGMMDLIWPSDTERQKRLSKIKAGSGHADLAGDGVALVAWYEEEKQTIHQWVAEAMIAPVIEQTRKLSHALMDLRKEADTPTDADAKKDLQARIYTLFEQTYNSLAAGGRYLFEFENPSRAEAYAPLFNNYLRRVRPPNPPKKATTSPSPEVIPSTETPTPSNTPSTPAA